MKTTESKIIHELTPELSEKIWKRIYDEKVSKEFVLHHLKQLKAEIGRNVGKYKNLKVEANYQDGLLSCINMIDRKISKINS